MPPSSSPNSDHLPAPGTSPFLAFPPGSGNFIGFRRHRQGSAPRAGELHPSYQLSDNVWLGLSTTRPVRAGDEAGAGLVRTDLCAHVEGVLAEPQPDRRREADRLAVRRGRPGLQYFDVRLRSASSFLATAPTTTLEGDDVGVGATAGALLTLPTDTQIGVGFRSAIRHELWGEIEVKVPAARSPSRRS